MLFLFYLMALLFEQIWPRRREDAVERVLAGLLAWVEHRLNTGSAQHGFWAWVLVMAVGIGTILGVAWLAAAISPLLGLVAYVVFFYHTVSFRQTTNGLTGHKTSLQVGSQSPAPNGLPGFRTARLSSGGLVKEAMVAAHRRTFGPLVWFILIPGPAGGFIYRATLMAADAWSGDVGRDFGAWPRMLGRRMDWLASMVTASVFAVVGNFEEAMYRWRHLPPSGGRDAETVLLAAASGALGMALLEPDPPPGSGPGDATPLPSPGASGPSSAAGLLKRAMLVFAAALVWLALLDAMTTG